MRESERATRRPAANLPSSLLPRLLPPIAMTDAFLATVSGLLVTGPLAGLYRSFYLKGCRHSWWMDVTFTSNLLFPHLADMGKTNEGATVGPAWKFQCNFLCPIIDSITCLFFICSNCSVFFVCILIGIFVIFLVLDSWTMGVFFHII